MSGKYIKVVISGVEGVNKGAELMLYAILQEIEKRFPLASVYLPISQFPNGLKDIKTSLKLMQSPNKFVRFLGKNHVTGVFNRLGMRSKYLNNLYPVKNADYYIDASGLYFSDQMISSIRVAGDLEILLKGYSDQGTKIIYLPQAFGPFEKEASIRAVKAALKYSNLLIARDDISFDYLSHIDCYKRYPVKKYYDFTGNVQGVFPEVYNYLKGRVCIILNKQVVKKGILSKEKYLSIIKGVVDVVYNKGFEAFFLDHEHDRDLINETIKLLPYEIPVISNLDALTTKGIIGQSYLCVSSRFHGVVSSFSNCVPCLTTSWNHKYQELLALYEMEDSLMSTSYEECVRKVERFLSPTVNKELRVKLSQKAEYVSQNIDKMWDEVWKIK